MLNIKVDAVLFIQRYSGIPLLSVKLNPRVLDIDPALVSGFLMAIQAFSSEVIEKGTEEFQIDYGKRIFTVIVGAETLAVAVTTEGASSDIIPILHDLQDEFEKEHYIDLEIHGSSSIYDEFKLKIAERFGLQEIDFSWVPEDKKCEGSELHTSQIAQFIDGAHSIQSIIAESGLSSELVLREISKLWAMGEIEFRRTLEGCDILIPTGNLFKFLQTNSRERSELNDFPESLLSKLPKVVSCFDGRTTVEDIVAQYDPVLYDLLDILVRKGALQILTPEKKRILLAKELLSKVLEIALRLYPAQTVLDILSQVLDDIDRPEIMTEVQVRPDGWKVDFGFLPYDNLMPNEIMQVHASWIKMLTNLVERLPQKKKRKLAEDLVLALQDDFFNKYAGDELDGFDKFSLALESEMC